MSTKFGIEDPNDGSLIEIAFRNNEGHFRWLNEVAKVLPNEMKVVAIDNTPQGIETVGDIRENTIEFWHLKNQIDSHGK